MAKNFHYVTDNAVIIITANTEKEADDILKDLVKYPQELRLDNITSVE